MTDFTEQLRRKMSLAVEYAVNEDIKNLYQELNRTNDSGSTYNLLYAASFIPGCIYFLSLILKIRHYCYKLKK